MGPRADEKFEESGKNVRKVGTYSVGPQHPLKRLIHMYSATEAEAKVDHLLLTIIFMTVFIRRASVEDNTTLECIGTVAPNVWL